MTTAVNALAVVTLGAVVALLSTHRFYTTARLRAVELDMAGLIAGVAAIFCLAILRYSLWGDVTSVQLVLNNLWLYATFEAATPKSRLRAGVNRWPAGPPAVLDPAGLLPSTPGGDGGADALDDTPRTVQLRRADPADPGRRLGLRGPARSPGCGGRSPRPGSSASIASAADRRRRDGRGLPGRAPAPQAPLRRQADPARAPWPTRGPWPGSSARSGLTATLSHPNTVEIYDYGRTEDGTYYYVMEYLPGLSLAELVERHGPLPPGRVGLPAAAGLPGAERGPRGGPDPPRHQAVEHLRRAARGHGRRGQAARLRPGPARGEARPRHI